MALDPKKFDIGEAVRCLLVGQRVRRSGWNGKGMFLVFVDADDWTSPVAGTPAQQFVAMRTADNMLVPWLCSQTDLIAEDWEIVEA